LGLLNANPEEIPFLGSAYVDVMTQNKMAVLTVDTLALCEELNATKDIATSEMSQAENVS